MSSADSASDHNPDRERIRAALVELVVELGYESVTEAAICGRAGVEEAQFLRCFRDKRDCLERAWEVLSAEHIDLVRGAAAAQDSWREGLRSAAYAALRYHQADQVRARFFLIEGLSTGEFAQSRRNLMMEAFVELIDEGRAELPDPEAPLAPRRRG